MELYIRKSKIGFEYFLNKQLHQVNYILRNYIDSAENESQKVALFSRANRLKELYDLFLLHLDDNEKAVVDYLSDTTPIEYKTSPSNYLFFYERVYEKWINVFFRNNVNNLPTINYKTLGKTMRYCRKERGFSLSDLGEILEIDYTLLSRYEKAERIPTLEFIYRFCSLMGIDISKFLKEVDNTNVHKM